MKRFWKSLDGVSAGSIEGPAAVVETALSILARARLIKPTDDAPGGEVIPLNSPTTHAIDTALRQIRSRDRQRTRSQHPADSIPDSIRGNFATHRPAVTPLISPVLRF